MRPGEDVCTDGNQCVDVQDGKARVVDGPGRTSIGRTEHAVTERAGKNGRPDRGKRQHVFGGEAAVSRYPRRVPDGGEKHTPPVGPRTDPRADRGECVDGDVPHPGVSPAHPAVR